ncbi:MAG: TIGR02757 family protein [Bacteroidota bacterium]
MKNTKNLPFNDLREFLDNKCVQYETPAFIEHDPVAIPHYVLATGGRKEDIEIAAFLSAIIAWGQRPVIVKNAFTLLSLMDERPYEFVMNAGTHEFKTLKSFVHRTFNSTDLVFFIKSLKQIYAVHGGMEKVFSDGFAETETVKGAIIHFRKLFLQQRHEPRAEKHLSDPERNSAAKRINLFLRWMLRKGCVDFGLWKGIPASALVCPLDVHTGNVSRALGLLTRTQSDWKAVEELAAALRSLDADDPVRYDYALFGLGMYEGFGR